MCAYDPLTTPPDAAREGNATVRGSALTAELDSQVSVYCSAKV